jgi:crotonobetainyl-CoA:carnitine CoA-transferase CaiB-like acyl-CoA transferase
MTGTVAGRLRSGAAASDLGSALMLSPYRVVDLTDHRANLAGLILAQLGAEVIAVEPPGGSAARRQGPFAGDVVDPERSLVHWSYNRGKRSVEWDLVGSPADRESFRSLVAGADILIDNEAPGALAAMGLDPADLAAVNPALVHVSVTPFGQDGPKAGYASSDLVLMAAGGYLALTGDEDRAPVRISLPQAWHHAAADAADAALIALVERRRSGLGQFVDVSVQASVLQATQSMVLSHPFGAPKVVRIAGGLKMPPLDLRLVWRCKDGHVTVAFLFGSSIGPFSERLFRWVHEEGFCDAATLDKDWIAFAVHVDEGRETVEEFERLKSCLAAFLATKTKAELLEESLRRRLLIAPVTTVADVADSPQLAFREYWEEVAVPALTEPVRMPGAITKASRTPLAPLSPPPRLGADTAAVRAELMTPRRPAVPDVPIGTDAGPLPLAGVKVLDFMWAMAGPATTRVMADYGATIVRVESEHKLEVARTLQPFLAGRSGAESSGLFMNMNAGKLGLALDMGNPQAREVILDLVRWADVLCESFSPRAMKAWGLDYETLREVNPRLIMLSSCLMGQTGPLASFAGFGNLAAAISGFHHITGWPDRDPSGPFSAYTDYVAPRFSLAVLLAALDERERTGVGQYFDFSQAEACLHLLAPALLDLEVNGRIAGRHGNDDPDLVPHGVYRCAARGIDDDRWVAIVVTDDEAWASLCGVLGRPDLAGLDRTARRARQDELDALLAAWAAGRDEEAAEVVLQAAGVAAHVVANSPESFADPQLAHRGHFTLVEHDLHGPVTIEGTRFRFSRTAPDAYRAAPTLGQDTFTILSELLGYDVDRIADLAAAQVLE